MGSLRNLVKLYRFDEADKLGLVSFEGLPGPGHLDEPGAVLFPTATVYVYFLFPIKIRTAAYIFAGISFYTIVQRGDNYGGEACHLAGLVFGVWWAMKGETWWALRGTKARPARATAPPSNSGGFASRIAQRRADAETVDRILKKVYEGGIHSLSNSEKRALQEATDRQRQAEQQAGRTDRL